MAPLALAGVPAIEAQEAAKKMAAAAPDPHANALPEPKKRWQIYEEEHFAHPLVFERHNVEPQVQPFALSDVTLAPRRPLRPVARLEPRLHAAHHARPAAAQFPCHRRPALDRRSAGRSWRSRTRSCAATGSATIIRPAHCSTPRPATRRSRPAATLS